MIEELYYESIRRYAEMDSVKFAATQRARNDGAHIDILWELKLHRSKSVFLPPKKNTGG